MSRPVDLELGNASSASDIKVRIKTSDGSGDLNLSINLSDTVATLKTKIQETVKVDENQYLRLIFNGKLLDPPEAILDTFRLTNNAYIHSVVSKKPTITPQSNRTIRTPATPPVNQRQGLDILLSTRVGNGRPPLNMNDINDIREQFTPAITAFAQQYNIVQQTNETPAAYRYRCEFQWMISQEEGSQLRQALLAYHLFGGSGNSRRAGTGSREGTGNSVPGVANVLNGGEEAEAIEDDEEDEEEEYDERGQLIQHHRGGMFAAALQDVSGGTTKDFLLGFMLGFALGILAMFCMRHSMNAKQKIGICVGVITQGFINAMFQPEHKNPYNGGHLRGSNFNNNGTIAGSGYHSVGSGVSGGRSGGAAFGQGGRGAFIERTMPPRVINIVTPGAPHF